MKIEFDLSTDKDVKYACEVFEKFAQMLPLPKVLKTTNPNYNMYFSAQNVLTEDSFIAALQYIALTNKDVNND